jgi:hypothetical protein
MDTRRILCRRQGGTFVVDLGREAEPAVFYLSREEAAAFAEGLESEIAYGVLGVEVFGRAAAPIMIADVAMSQQEARSLLVAVQTALNQKDERQSAVILWQREGF